MVDFRGELLTLCTGDLSLSGAETRGKEPELVGEAGIFGDALISVTSVTFLRVAGGGASHMSTSLELSESCNEITSSDSEISCGTSLAGSALLSEWSLFDEPAPFSDHADSGCSAVLDVSTLVDCSGVSEESEEEVVGVSGSLARSREASTFDRFVSGCSGIDVLAFLFPRSRLVIEGLRNNTSKAFRSFAPDVPAVLRG